MSSNTRRRLGTEPGLREALARGAQALAETHSATAEGPYRTMDRAGVLGALGASAKASSDKRSAEIRARGDARAVEFGYRDVADLLAQTAGRPAVPSQSVGHRLDSDRRLRHTRSSLAIPPVRREECHRVRGPVART